ncbi:MAG: LysR family transcriptional regulator [Opitutaceae bacterium]|nr:LysR family transcriptional regulator [Opitutaceae bacterium]
MELRHLRYFAAVARALSFRAAAEDLNLSTPALSKQIRDLESEIGVRLLDRDTTRVSLTKAGAVFLEEASAILLHAGAAVQRARDAAQGNRGRLAIGNIGPIAANHLAASLAKFCSRYPGVEIDLIDMDVPSQVAALSRKEIDIGFIPANTRPPLPPMLESVLVFSTPLCAVLGADHRLATRDSVPLAELAKERLLCISTGKQSLHRPYIRAVMEGRGLKAQRLVDVKGFESLLAMIAGGQGVSLLAGRSGLTRVDNLVVRPLREAGQDLEVAIWAVWRSGKDSLLAQRFIDAFRETARTSGKIKGHASRFAA